MKNPIRRLGEIAKRSSLGRMFTKMHIYCIGAPKTGTTSVASIFEDRYRAAHEPQPRESIELAMAYETGEIDDAETLELVDLRDRILGLDCESAFYLVALAPVLVEAFPASRYLFPVRHPRSWLRSVIDQSINSPRGKIPEHWIRLRDHNYGALPRKRPPEEKSLSDFSGVHGIAGYLSYWARHHGRVLDVIPRERLLPLELTDLSSSLDEIAAFVDVSPSSLNGEKSHVHSAPERHGVLDPLPSEYVEGLIEEICGPTISRIQAVLPRLAWATPHHPDL